MLHYVHVGHFPRSITLSWILTELWSLFKFRKVFVQHQSSLPLEVQMYSQYYIIKYVCEVTCVCKYHKWFMGYGVT
jgi:hypothetical protein